MKIRTKLSLILFASIVACTVGVSFSFIYLERRQLARQNKETMALLADAVSKAVQESMINQDELMAISYVNAMLKEHPELLTVRIQSASGPLELGAKEVPWDEDPVELDREATLGGRRGSEPARIEIQLVFSGKRLDDQTRAILARSIRNAANVSALVCLGAILAAFLLGRTMTRPILDLTEAIEHLGEGRLGTQVGEVSSDELGRVAAKLNETSRKLLELDQMKRQFVASVTHELRSPLGAMESYIRMLRENNGITQQQQVHLKRIEENAARLGQFITNLLEKAKIERGQMEYDPQEADLGFVLEETAIFFQPRFREAGLELSIDRAPGVPKAWMDPERIQQVLVNLISNALKFTPRGGKVTVHLSRMRQGGLLCEVQDTGVGLSKEDAGRIFQPFERIRNRIKAQGAGLGLSISKAIVERHGGQIGVRSEPGGGSSFWFTVPAADQRRTA